jgi:hypothetical protein
MILSKSAIVVCSPASSSPIAHLSSLTSSIRSAAAPPHPHQVPERQRRQQQRRLQRPRCRFYATHQSKDDRDHLPDWPRNPHPTPYEIFDIARSAPYTKKRFYQLVKLYHPDKHHSSQRPTDDSASPSSNLRPSTAEGIHPAPAAESGSGPPPHPSLHITSSARLERYRLVVAANDLLSSPSKRHLYDTHGVGWLPSSDPLSHHSHADLRRADRAWRSNPNSAAHNATWEDWERWHAQQHPDASHGERRPRFMSDSTFASLVVLLCLIGALAQKSRAQTIGAEFMEMKSQQHANIGHQLGQRGKVTASMGRDERISAFVLERENSNYQLVPGKHDSISPR